MCNKVHKTPFEGTRHKMVDPKFKEIPKTGTGWKVFRRRDDGQIVPLFSIHSGYAKPSHFSDGFVYYEPRIVAWPERGEEGFCFFQTRRAAWRLFVTMVREGHRYTSSTSARGSLRVLKIVYRGGLGSFLSDETDGVLRRVSICREFKLADDKGGEL